MLLPHALPSLPPVFDESNIRAGLGGGGGHGVMIPALQNRGTGIGWIEDKPSKSAP